MGRLFEALPWLTSRSMSQGELRGRWLIAIAGESSIDGRVESLDYPFPFEHSTHVKAVPCATGSRASDIH
jgi:hypothetical protein